MTTWARLMVCFGFAILGNPVAGQEPKPQAGEEKKYAHEFYADFRGKSLPPELTFVGKDVDQHVRSEPNGLRITLPADREDLNPVGVGTRFGVRGDFEITATVEILQADVPEKGFGVGATLYIHKVDPPTDGTNIGRLMRPKNDFLMWDLRYDKPGKEPIYDGGAQPRADKLVRLRLQRTGDQLTYWWAAGARDGAFKQLAKRPFGADEVNQVIVRALTGHQRCNVDVRLIDLRVRSGSPLQAKDLPPAGAPANVAIGAQKQEHGSRIWLVLGLLVALTIALALAASFGLWLYLRRRNVSSE